MTTLRVLAAVGVAASALTLLPTSTANAVATCQGQPATIEQSTGTVTGTPGPDVIVVSGTVTLVDAKEGDDLVCVSATVEMDTWLEIVAGPGDDAIDATASGAPVAANLGAGRDSYAGGDAQDSVGASEYSYTYDAEGDVGPDRITTGGGDDRLGVVPGVVVDASLGSGDDHVAFATTYAGEGSTFDLGADHDSLEFVDDYDAIRDPGDTTLRANLRSEVLVWRGVSSVLRGAEDISAVARNISVRGNAEANLITTTGCRITLKGREGDDRLYMRISHSGDEMPFRCGKNNKQGTWRALGNGGNDLLHGGNQHDVLIGGPGRDVANGWKHGDDICDAERVKGKGCKG